MSAPSVLHESRVGTLTALADLAGYTVDVQFDSRHVPDLTRLHRSMPRLLVADAKATEHPLDLATRHRLVNYAASSRSWLSAGFQVSLMLCHEADPHGEWSSCLTRVLDAAGVRALESSATQIDPVDWVTRVRLSL